MSLFAWFADMRAVTKELRLIREALERYSPPPDLRPAEPLRPEDVTYASDEQMALDEMREEARKLGILPEDEESAHES